MVTNGEFVEVKYVHGTVYGTSIAEVERASRDGIAVTDVDVQGVAEYKEVSNGVVAIFVVPPSYDAWISRLKRRYTTNEDFLAEWPKRRDSAIKELTRALEVPYYHCVINDSIERAVEVTAEIARRPDMFTRKDDEARLAARDLLQQISM
jgi:guanylate kinase